MTMETQPHGSFVTMSSSRRWHIWQVFAQKTVLGHPRVRKSAEAVQVCHKLMLKDLQCVSKWRQKNHDHAHGAETCKRTNSMRTAMNNYDLLTHMMLRIMVNRICRSARAHQPLGRLKTDDESTRLQWVFCSFHMVYFWSISSWKGAPLRWFLCSENSHNVDGLNHKTNNVYSTAMVVNMTRKLHKSSKMRKNKRS